jgi:hypothetical protein
MSGTALATYKNDCLIQVFYSMYAQESYSVDGISYIQASWISLVKWTSSIHRFLE